MTTPLPQQVKFPWLDVAVDVDVDEDFTELTGEEHLALANMQQWSDALRARIERACFADYLDKVDAIAAVPPTVPVIKRPDDIWRHVEVSTVRPQGPDLIVVYAIPEWDLEEQHEWCIRGTDELVYVGQVLSYDPESYADVDDSINRARHGDEIIERLQHLPQDWPDA